MPKISKHSGPSHKGEVRPQQPAPAVEVRVDVPSVDERLAELVREVVSVSAEPLPPAVEEVESSPGSSSSASTPKPPTSTEPSKPARRKPAHRTASRSGQDPTVSSSVPSTAGDPTAPTSATE